MLLFKKSVYAEMVQRGGKLYTTRGTFIAEVGACSSLLTYKTVRLSSNSLYNYNLEVYAFGKLIGVTEYRAHRVGGEYYTYTEAIATVTHLA